VSVGGAICFSIPVRDVATTGHNACAHGDRRDTPKICRNLVGLFFEVNATDSK